MGLLARPAYDRGCQVTVQSLPVSGRELSAFNASMILSVTDGIDVIKRNSEPQTLLAVVRSITELAYNALTNVEFE